MSEYVGEYVVSLTAKTFTGLRFHRHEEIVRCRDCAFFREKDWRCTSSQWHNCDESPEVEPDGFCAWGERRD